MKTFNWQLFIGLKSRVLKQKIISKIIAALVLYVLVTGPSTAQNRGRSPQTGGGFGGSLPTPGLSVRFPDNAGCAPIASAYGSPTRYDGSSRRTGGGPGSTHGGIDLTLAEGTPLLAVAAGTVFGHGTGGMMEGHYLWLLHLPERSGLPFAFLTKYQHLAVRPTMPHGQVVSLGQEVARSGLTGTVGGHYGAAGYPHLHMTVRTIISDKVASTTSLESFSIVRDTIQVDPLVLYVPSLRVPEEAEDLSPERKKVVASYVDSKGSVQPPLAHTVWPVACDLAR